MRNVSIYTKLEKKRIEVDDKWPHDTLLILFINLPQGKEQYTRYKVATAQNTKITTKK